MRHHRNRTHPCGACVRFGDHFIKRVFTEEEQAYCSPLKYPHKHYAARWAAKEAVSKAFSTGIGPEFGWTLRFSLSRRTPPAVDSPRRQSPGIAWASRRHAHPSHAFAQRHPGDGRRRAGQTRLSDESPLVRPVVRSQGRLVDRPAFFRLARFSLYARAEAGAQAHASLHQIPAVPAGGFWDCRTTPTWNTCREFFAVYASKAGMGK